MGSTFGQILKRLRLDRGFTLRELQDLTGISNAYLSQLETGKRGVPSLKIVGTLSKALGVDTEHMVKLAMDAQMSEENETSEPDEEMPLYLEWFTINIHKLTSENQNIVRDLIVAMLKRQDNSAKKEK